MARALRPVMPAREWYQFKAEESRAIAEELSDLDCKMKMLRNATTWDMLSNGPYLTPRRHFIVGDRAPIRQLSDGAGKGTAAQPKLRWFLSMESRTT